MSKNEPCPHCGGRKPDLSEHRAREAKAREIRKHGETFAAAMARVRLAELLEKNPQLKRVREMNKDMRPPIDLPPGLADCDNTNYSSSPSWVDASAVRFIPGKPTIIAGWQAEDGGTQV